MCNLRCFYFMQWDKKTKTPRVTFIVTKRWKFKQKTTTPNFLYSKMPFVVKNHKLRILTITVFTCAAGSNRWHCHLSPFAVFIVDKVTRKHLHQFLSHKAFKILRIHVKLLSECYMKNSIEFYIVYCLYGVICGWS